jgi:hypothetical protein
VASGNTARVRREALRIDPEGETGWGVSPLPPTVGDVVKTVEGPGEVVRVLGKISDGTSLLEIRIAQRDGPPYFAATSNVLQRVGPVDQAAS